MQIAGIALSTPPCMAILNACGSSRQEAAGLLFPEEVKDLVAAISESIIPRTDTPGALDLEVPAFIERVISNCWEDSGKNFQAGLKEFANMVQSEYRKDFQALSPGEKEEILLKEEAWYLHQIKQLSILGYMTSEYVMTQILDYQPIPIDFVGCRDIGGTRVLVADNTL